MRRLILYCLATGVLLSAVPLHVSWGSAAGRRNTAIAATALAVGAWSNGTGRAGRRNTALLATGGAAYAWSRYSSKKRDDRRRTSRRARVLAFREERGDRGLHRGHWIGKGHWKHHGHGHHHHHHDD